MRLYLVQHGEAFSKEENPERPLTEEGRKDSGLTAEFLKKAHVKPDAIWHSTKTRAMETARIFAGKLAPEEGVAEKEGLAPNDDVKKAFNDISSIEKDIMVVGHLPFLQKLASLALCGSESGEVVKFNMAGCVCLEKDETGKWQVIFEIIPDLLK